MNSFPALYGSLEQIHLGPPKSSVEGSSEVPPASKVPPRFQQCLCFSSTDPSWAANSFRLKRLYGIRQDCRADPFWGAKRFCGRFPHHFFKRVSWFHNSFFHFSQQLSLWSSVIVKVLGQNDMFVFLRSWQHMAFASQKVFWSVPQTVISIGLTVSCGFFWANFRKGSVQGSADHSSHLSPTGMLLHSNSLEGSANFALHLSQSRVNCWHVSPMEIQSGETTHHVVAVGVFFGLISLNLVGESQKKNQRLSPKKCLETFFTSEIIYNFSGEQWGICSRSLVESLVSTNLPKKLNTSLS